MPVVWYTNQPLYFTDPGDLSASVNHAAADALVAAAANVWNVPTASLVLAQGGTLDEHVSGANTFLGPSGLIFPADVQSSNYPTMQIAVIYDSDGSVTDLLLGNGASDPTSCLQNGVTESVDSIVPAGYIQHAVLVLNGRCTGTRSGAADAAAVSVDAGVWAGAGAGVVADERQCVYGESAGDLQPGDALAGDASDRYYLRAVYVSVHAAAVYVAAG